MDFAGVSRLFLDSLALSAWKQYGGERWALRVNPSSGNLHPTEGYLICGPVSGLTETPMVAHYAPREHALEVRATFPLDDVAGVDRRSAARCDPGRPDLDPLARGVEIRPARLSLLPARRGPRAGGHQHRRGGAGLAGAPARWAEHGAGRRAAGRGGSSRAGGGARRLPGRHLSAWKRPGGYQQPAGLSPETVESFHHLAWQGQPNRLSSSHVAWEWIDAAARPHAQTRDVRSANVHASRITFHV